MPLHFDSILIITYGRSGSTLLQGIINDIDGVIIRGENENFIEGLYIAYKRLVKAKNRFGHHEGSKSPKHAWYGVQDIDIDTFLENCKKSIKDVLVGNSDRINFNGSKTICYGFKEIRYIDKKISKVKISRRQKLFYYLINKLIHYTNSLILKINHILGKEIFIMRNPYDFKFPNILYQFLVDDFEDFLDFLLQVFPKPCLIFNTRNLDDVSQSFWWANIDKKKVLDILSKVEDDFRKYCLENPDHTYMITYEDMVSKTQRLEDLFNFLGAEYSPSKINKILSISHSCRNRSRILENQKEV